MLAQPLVVAAAALAAATCYSISDVVEQRKASQAPPEASLKIALLWHLARQGVWWLGILADVGGFAFQALALGIGDIVFVQPLLLASLPMSLLLGHRVGSHELTRRDLGYSLAFVVALAVFLSMSHPTVGAYQRPLEAWLIAFVLIGAVTIWVMTVSHRLERSTRALALGLAGGMLFGVSSTLMKTFSHEIADDGWAMLTHWEPYVMGGVVTLGFLVVQSAFQVGDLRSSLPAIALAEPLTAGVLGLTLLHERLSTTSSGETGVLVTALVVMVWSTLALARSAAEDHAAPPDALDVVT